MLGKEEGKEKRGLSPPTPSPPRCLTVDSVTGTAVSKRRPRMDYIGRRIYTAL